MMMNGDKIVLSRSTETGFFQTAGNYLEMLKLHLCVYIGISAIFGHVIAQKIFTFDALLLGGFVWILACGAAVLNNIQDRNYDACFSRTRERSLPQKKVSVGCAAFLAGLMIAAGLAGLFWVMGIAPFLWGVAAIVSYNGFYTPLKKRSVLAIVPGSISGMLPPVIGWAAAKMSLADPVIWMMASVFGLWQISHYLIILLKTLSDKNRGQSMYPCFSDYFSRQEIQLQILIWTSLYSLSMLLLGMKENINNPLAAIVTVANALIICMLISLFVLKPTAASLTRAFSAINLSMLVFMGTGICGTGLFPIPFQ